MNSDDFWSVELGARMGPLVLGSEYESVLQVLRDHGIDADRLRLDRTGLVAVQEIRTRLQFSEIYPRTLVRMDVDDERLRFGSLDVIGKRVHEIIGLFKVSRKSTLWRSVESNSETPELVAGGSRGNTTELNRELLARGTIWIPGLGLGLTLRDGLVGTVHLCHSSESPRSGTGTWTKEQQMLSEVRELPAAGVTQNSVVQKNRHNRRLVWGALIHFALVTSIGILVMGAMQLQRRWDAAIETRALVVGLDPPPPSVLPNSITVSFLDSSGVERRQTLEHMQFEMAPKLGNEVKVRYLLEEPEKVLGPVASREVGFIRAFPYGVGILAIYSVLQLIVYGVPRRARRKRR